MSKEIKKPEEAKVEGEAKEQENPVTTENPPAETEEKKGFFYNAGYAVGKVWNSKPAKKVRKVAKIGALLGVGFAGGYAAGKGEIPFVGGKDSNDSDVVDSTATDVTGSDEN